MTFWSIYRQWGPGRSTVVVGGQQARDRPGSVRLAVVVDSQAGRNRAPTGRVCVCRGTTNKGAMGLRSLLIRYTHRNLKLSDFRATRNASPLASTRNRRLHSHNRRRQPHWKKGAPPCLQGREAAPKRHSQPASRAQEKKRTRTPVARPLYNGTRAKLPKQRETYFQPCVIRII